MSGSIGTILGGVGGFLIGGPAGAAIGASIGSGVDGSRAAGKAADAEVQASNDATAEARRQYDLTRGDTLSMYDQQRADQAPYRQAGVSALQQLSSGIAPGGDFSRKFTLADFTADPGYQFRMDQGMQGIQRSAAARGGMYSGATLKALARFNQDTASQEYGAAYGRFNNDNTTAFNRLASLAGIGQTATNATGADGTNANSTIANAGANTSSAIQQAMYGAGNARASGYIGRTNAIGNGIGQALNFYQGSQMLNGIKGSGSGGPTGSLYDLYSSPFTFG